MADGEEVAAPSGTAPPLWRRALPWVIAIGLLVVVFLRVDVGEVLTRMGDVPLPLYCGFVAVSLLSNLTLDSLASWKVYLGVAPKVTFRELFVVRGASYLPATINFHVGQAYLTYLLSRGHQVALTRVAGATLLSYGTFFGGVIAVTAVALPLAWVGAAGGATGVLEWAPSYIGLLVVAGLLYLVVLRLNPAFLRDRSLLAPLFAAGPLGHMRLLAWRLPYVVVLVAQLWGAYAFFGVSLPAGAALVLMPMVLLVSALPITPQGLGARELVAIQLLAPWSDGDAAIVAAGTAWSLASMVAQAISGLAFAPAAAKYLR